MTGTHPHISRRTALQTVTSTALVSVAGCLNNGRNTGSSDDATAASTGSGPFKQVDVEGTSLVVELTGDAAVDQLNLIQPNGEQFGTREVAAGVQQVSFEIGTDYEPGEYPVVGLNDGESVVETSRPIQPNLSIVEMGIGRNQPEQMWDGQSDEIAEEAFVTVENKGSGPDAIRKLLFVGDVPYPSDEDGTNYASDKDVSGIYSPQSDSEVSEVIVEAGNQVTIYSSRSPFAFVPGSGTSCRDEQQSGEFDLVLETSVGEIQLSETYNVQYSASAEVDNCEITISRI